MTASTVQRSTTSARHRAVSEVLLDVCRDGVTTVPGGPLAAGAIVDAARHHRIAPLTHVRLREAAPAVAELLREDRDAAKSLHIGAGMLLAQVHRTLGDVPWVVFKGPVLSELAHPVPGLRRYGDLDLLVDPRSLRETTARLQAAGWVVADYEDMLRNPQTPGEMHWYTPAGIPVDLHWSMINMAVRRRLFDVPTVDILERRTPVRIGLGEAWTMEPADMIVHVSLHAALTGANKLGWLLDVDQLARRTTDWAAVARRAREWGAHAQVALVLRRAAATLGTPVPDGAVRLLGASAGLRTLLTAVDGVSPVARHRRDATVSRLVARAVRRGAVRTVGVVARNAARGVVDRARPAGGPAAARTQASPEALEHYLNAVEAQAGAAAAPSAGA